MSIEKIDDYRVKKITQTTTEQEHTLESLQLEQASLEFQIADLTLRLTETKANIADAKRLGIKTTKAVSDVLINEEPL